jgi:hypothetical protein
VPADRQISLVYLRSGRHVAVAELPEEVIRQATDQGGPRFLELEQVPGKDKVWVAAAEIAMVSPAELVDLAEQLAKMRGPDPDARPA